MKEILPKQALVLEVGIISAHILWMQGPKAVQNVCALCTWDVQFQAILVMQWCHLLSPWYSISCL